MAIMKFCLYILSQICLQIGPDKLCAAVSPFRHVSARDRCLISYKSHSLLLMQWKNTLETWMLFTQFSHHKDTSRLLVTVETLWEIRH